MTAHAANNLGRMREETDVSGALDDRDSCIGNLNREGTLPRRGYDHVAAAGNHERGAAMLQSRSEISKDSKAASRSAITG